jgi:hypothetical protein
LTATDSAGQSASAIILVAAVDSQSVNSKLKFDPNLINIGIGKSSKVSASVTAQCVILVTNGSAGNFVSNVAVLKGIFTLNPTSGANSPVSVLVGTVQVVTLNTAVSGVTSAPVTLTQGNLNKTQIAALAASAVGATTVSVGKNGAITISSEVPNADGSITIGSVTVVNNVVTKDKWTTKDANRKTLKTWSQSTKSIALSSVVDGYTLKATISTSTHAGTATLKGPNGTTYKGTVTYDPTTGVNNFKSLPAKDGSSALFKYAPNSNGGYMTTTTVINKSGLATQTATTISQVAGIKYVRVTTGTIVSGAFVADATTPKTTLTQLPVAPQTETAGSTQLTQNSPPAGLCP